MPAFGETRGEKKGPGAQWGRPIPAAQVASGDLFPCPYVYIYIYICTMDVYLYPISIPFSHIPWGGMRVPEKDPTSGIHE